nr:ethylene-responsive transcription factor ERF055-like [Lolium perenne]
MPPLRRPASGYHGVRARPSGRFDAEIRSGDERIRLGTFDTAHEAARAYDAIAWRLGRSRRTMNFHDVWTREQAEMLAPSPPAITREQQRRQRELEQRLLIAERDKALRLEWARRFPEDVTATEAFYAQKEEEKAAAKSKKKASRDKRHAESTFAPCRALQNRASGGGAFFRTSVRCKMEHPAGENSVSRAPAVYSAAKRRFSAPAFCAPIGDALMPMNDEAIMLV